MISLSPNKWSAVAALTLAFLPRGLAKAQIKDAKVLETMPADPRISAALQQISPDRIRASVEKLVSFDTRSTISPQDSSSIAAGRGVGAARDWIRAEFERYAAECGACLEVKTDTFTEAPSERIPQPTEITNVYAVLPGSDPQNAKRIVLVTGHYDSRNSDILDVKGDAPGANDDAAEQRSVSNVRAS